MSLLLHSIASILKEKGEEKDEYLEILKNLYLYLKRGADVPTESQIGQFLKASPTQQELLDLSATVSYGDRRLQRLYLKGVRKFPPSENNFYSLVLGEADECYSCVFLGTNGVGKTSLYSAIEWASLGRLDSAKCRGYKDNESQIEFLKYHNADSKEVEIYLHSRSGIREFNLSSSKDLSVKFSLPAFFCMEQDVVELSKSDYSYYIAEQIGLSDFFELIGNIERLHDSYKNYIDRYNAEVIEIADYEFKLTLLTRLSQINDCDYSILLNASDILSARKHLKHKTSNRICYYSSLVRRIKRIRSLFVELMGDYKDSEDKVTRIYNFVDAKELEIFDSRSTQLLESTIEDRIPRFEKLLISIYEALSPTVIEESSQRSMRALTKMQYLNVDLYKISDRINQKKGILHNLEKECGILGVEYHRITGLEQVRILLLNEYREYITELVKIGDSIFNYVFNDFLGNDISSVRLEVSSNQKSLNVVFNAINPIDQSVIGEVNPRKYLNTFRFKLFCVLLKVALSFCCMKWYNIEFPIVIDDVFDSSDFNNRERIRTLIHKIYCSYSKLFKEREHPLQMIFFTQDDVISDSVYRGIKDSPDFGTVKYSRIFNFTEAKDYEWKDGILNGKKIKILNIEDTIESHAQKF